MPESPAVESRSPSTGRPIPRVAAALDGERSAGGRRVAHDLGELVLGSWRKARGHR